MCAAIHYHATPHFKNQPLAHPIPDSSICMTSARVPFKAMYSILSNPTTCIHLALIDSQPPVAVLTFATSPLRPSQFLETVDLATPLSVASLCAGDLPTMERSPDLSSPTWKCHRSSGWCLAVRSSC